MDLRDAIDRARENSSYLKDSLELFPDLAGHALLKSPEDLIENEYAQLPGGFGAHADEMAWLRILKRRVHLITALSDISGRWSWIEVTSALTVLSDLCMTRLLIACARELDIYSGQTDNPVPGLFILAMGKYGAGELNYSSDIDFCVFYDPDLIDLPRPERAQRTLIKFVQLLIAGFERITGEGYIFRTDLRLRPDPRSNAVAVSTLTAERYYETLGQNWERAAMIKARVCGGDMAAGAAFSDSVLRPFIWRRSLDYAAIEDIHSIKRQIQSRQGGEVISAPGHHIKLGTGGIREIEFYAQTQQLILGGRNKELRTPRTVDALAALASGGYIDPEDAAVLTHHYAKLRRFEHAAQMREDAQTHISPEDDAARQQLAKLAGHNSLAAFDEELVSVLTEVHARYTGLFPEYESLGLEEGTLSFTGVEPYPSTLETLQALGFEDRERVWRDMASWLGGRISATRTERARELLTRLAPRLIKICAQTKTPDAAFRAFGSFFERVNGGVSLLSMFLQAPQRLSQIIDLMLISPRLSDTLSGRPAILDGMISPNFMDIDIESLGEDYSDALQENFDFEDAMNFVRARLREDQFRISASVLAQHTEITHCAPLLSQLAEKTLEVMLPVAAKETRRSIGELNGDFAILALGKAGGRELSLASDLDVMLIYDAPGEQQTAYTKLTQRLISAVSAVTAEGRLYELDMALRPSGRSGPVAVSLDAFERYYAGQAWTWEFMALTRARVIAASSGSFANTLAQSVAQVICLPRNDLDMPKDILDMRARLVREKPARGPWDVKQMQGGLRDLEFITQALYLARRSDYAGRELTSTQAMLSRAHNLGQITDHVFAKLSAAAAFFQALIQGLALTHGSLSGEVSIVVIDALANILDLESVEVLRQESENHAQIIKRLFPEIVGPT